MFLCFDNLPLPLNKWLNKKTSKILVSIIHSTPLLQISMVTFGIFPILVVLVGLAVPVK